MTAGSERLEVRTCPHIHRSGDVGCGGFSNISQGVPLCTYTYSYFKKPSCYSR